MDSILRIPFYIFFGFHVFGIRIEYFYCQTVGEEDESKIFMISDENIEIDANYNSLSYSFDYADINLISLVGTAESLRFFKIESLQKKIKIRLGTYGLAPFSESKDIQTMDDMITKIETFVENKGFIVKKVKTANRVFEYGYIK